MAGSIDEITKGFRRLGLYIPEILLPHAKVDLSKWSVIACDQFTSSPAYWNETDSLVGQSPSSLRLTLPEIYLEMPDVNTRITTIHKTMQHYISEGILEPHKDCLLYIRRTTERAGIREGLIVAVDLEHYDFSPGSETLIRATEGTIVERIPPRLAVRENAPIEIPHIMILIDDPDSLVIEALSHKKDSFRKAYSTELMKSGGKLDGWIVDKHSDLEQVAASFQTLFEKTKQKQETDKPLFLAMGDGNHSLATAKTHWEGIKKQLLANSEETRRATMASHPARFALAEIVNIHSPGLIFEPIHRVFFLPNQEEFLLFLKKSIPEGKSKIVSESEAQALLKDRSGQYWSVCFTGQEFIACNLENELGVLPPQWVDSVYDTYKKNVPQARIDFIHGWAHTKELAGKDAVVFFMPVIERDRLFRHIQTNGPLPRKAFSLGEAEEKRYYMEARRIVP